MEKIPFTELPLRKKLSTKLFVVTLIWWFSALLALFFTLSLLWQLQGAGAAINDAGSLRMRTYQLVILNQFEDKADAVNAAEEFSVVLNRLVKGDPKRPLMLPQDNQIIEQAELLLSRWNEQVLPELLISDKGAFNYDKANLFVSDIDVLVQMVEKSNADTLKRLHFYQYFLIVLVIAGSLVMLYILYRLIIQPLQRLNYAFLHAQQGDFSYQETDNRDDNEFGLLSIGYNKMAKRLETVYRGLEQSIKEKTENLQQRNSELESLYSITSFLHDQHDIKTICQGFLDQVVPILNADSGAIRLHDYNDQKMQLVAEVNLSSKLSNSLICERFDKCYCGQFALAESATEEFAIQSLLQSEPPCAIDTYKTMNIFPIYYDKEKIGIITFFSHESTKLDIAKKNLIESLSNQLGIAIGGVRLLERTSRLAVLEERNLLAQGLHDSISQALNFLNLQVQMLEKAFHTDNKAAVSENLAFIKDGIKESYDNVRELLLNFRTPLRLESFSHNLEELIERFKQQTSIEVTAMVDASNINLSDKEKLEIVLIIQEALSNIRKHAKATKVSLQIYNDGNNNVIKVIDNGIGFKKELLRDKSVEHVGHLIMSERAQKIGGQLSIHSQLGEGTELHLMIPTKP